MNTFIAYYRVSTDRQGRSGLGLEAQRTAVGAYLRDKYKLVAEFTEIESGKRNDRPELMKALAECKRQHARLIIAKLDRLARNLHFISGLMESGIEFIACDVPGANRMMLQILAVFAEHEREMISKRTKEALAAAKARGCRLGNPNPLPAGLLGSKVSKEVADQFAGAVKPFVQSLQMQGLSLRGIASEMNLRSIKTAKGRKWYATTVRNVLVREVADQK
ncbi:MAG: resolvase [Alphaproteobacteria bacterium 41-28]|jgi:DNA invertase Pin-like site-specific DNA recombinase|nr:MAG: resolvase [Alphaproteobacteria bacterium 41-28]